MRHFLNLLPNPLFLLVGAQLLYVAGGILFLEFDVTWLEASLAVAAALAAEILFKNGEARLRGAALPGFFFSPSAVAAALGIAIFFRASNPLFFALAALIAIASKYLLRVGGKHVFNPSNIGIVSLIFLLPGAATVELTQWGNSIWVYAGVAALSFFIAWRAGVILTTASFLLSYTALLLPLVALWPGIFSAHHLGLLGPSLVLFASFMITDPQTSPQGTVPRVLHGISIALLYFALEAVDLQYAIFAASFGVSLLNGGWNLLCARDASWKPLAHGVSNSVTTAIVSLVFALTFTGFLLNPVGAGAQKPSLISKSFLLYGIESDSLYFCNASPALEAADSALAAVRSVTASAWGDFDGDGLDDIFLSQRNGLGGLYRNLGAGEFVDITEAAGLPVLQLKSAFFADYDNDGTPDLFLLEQLYPLPFADYEHIAITAANVRVYRNNGDGTFSDATRAAGLSGTDTFDNLSFADVDNDGDLDLLATQQGGRFPLIPATRVALEKTVADPTSARQMWLTCNPGEIRTLAEQHPLVREGLEEAGGIEALLERDGCLHFSSSINLSPGDSGDSPALRSVLGGASIISGHARLYRNDGGVFTEVPSFGELIQARVREREAAAFIPIKEGEHPFDFVSGTIFQALFFDYDRDGRHDIFLAVDTGSNLLLRNTGNFSFVDVTAKAGLNYSASGMGADTGDFDHNGYPDLVVTNALRDFIYQNNGDGTFSNLDFPNLGATGIGWGVAFLDYDLDGYDDLFVANGDMFGLFGDTDERLARSLFRLDNLYRNEGGGIFSDQTAKSICSDLRSGKSLAVSDYDNDGDPDVFVGNLDLPGVAEAGGALYRNTAVQKGAHFIKVRLRGTRDNTAGVGAAVEVSGTGFTQRKEVTLGSSYRSQNSGALIFGLGAHQGPVDIIVRWPSGDTTKLTGVAADQEILVRQ